QGLKGFKAVLYGEMKINELFGEQQHAFFENPKAHIISSLHLDRSLHAKKFNKNCPARLLVFFNVIPVPRLRDILAVVWQSEDDLLLEKSLVREQVPSTLSKLFNVCF
ncbi:hypothetical protein ACJX0J_041626, partial [Zea mays]